MTDDLDKVAREFTRLGDWMGPVVAADPDMLDVVTHRRPGQIPVSVFFASVHYLLLAGVQHELREWCTPLRGC